MTQEEVKKYPSNAKRNKLDKPKSEPVVKGGVVVRKKSPGSNFVETFLGDNLKTIGTYIFADVLIPAAKDAINDMVQGGIEMLLYGTNDGRRSKSNKGGGYISYNNYSNKQKKQKYREEATPKKKSYGNVIVSVRSEAEAVIDGLIERCDEYGEVSIADLYELIDVTGDFTDNQWGWTDLSSACVRRVREGYLVDLPKPIVLD